MGALTAGRNKCSAAIIPLPVAKSTIRPAESEGSAYPTFCWDKTSLRAERLGSFGGYAHELHGDVDDAERRG